MTTEDTLSRLTLERFVLGRLDATERAEVEGRVAEDPELETQLARIQREISEAEEDLPPLDPGIFQQPEAPTLTAVPPPPARRWRWAGLGAAVLAAGAALAVIPQLSGSGETFRGAFDLDVQHIRAGSVASVGVMVQARAGDRIQYTVTAPQDGWLMVADLQDDGELSWWAPPRRVTAHQAIEGAVILDDYGGGSERAYFLIGQRPLELDALRTAYADAHADMQPLVDLDVLPGIDADQRSILIVRTAK